MDLRVAFCLLLSFFNVIALRNFDELLGKENTWTDTLNLEHAQFVIC